MREQLKLLEELQRHDLKVQELEGQKRALPEKLAMATAGLAEYEKLLVRDRAALAENEEFQKDQERQRKDAEVQLQKSKVKQGQVRTAKEGEASTRELESAKKALDSRGEDLAKFGQALTDQRSKLKDREDRLAADQAALKQQEADTQREVARLEEALVTARAAREEAAKALKADALRKYNYIQQRKRGLAVVAVKDGTCRGCNMNIPPQLYNIIQRGNSLELCPNCNRLIYWSRLLEPEESKAEAKGDEDNGKVVAQADDEDSGKTKTRRKTRAQKPESSKSAGAHG